VLCWRVPVHPHPEVVLEELRENRQDGRGAVSPASQDIADENRLKTALFQTKQKKSFFWAPRPQTQSVLAPRSMGWNKWSNHAPQVTSKMRKRFYNSIPPLVWKLELEQPARDFTIPTDSHSLISSLMKTSCACSWWKLGRLLFEHASATTCLFCVVPVLNLPCTEYAYI
jgi:hypothetical protein